MVDCRALRGRTFREKQDTGTHQQKVEPRIEKQCCLQIAEAIHFRNPEILSLCDVESVSLRGVDTAGCALHGTVAHLEVPQNIHRICWALREDLEDVRVHHPVRGKEAFHSRRRSRWSLDEQLGAFPVTLSARRLPEACQALDEIFFGGIAVKAPSVCIRYTCNRAVKCTTLFYASTSCISIRSLSIS